jgi:hypothetical protein
MNIPKYIIIHHSGGTDSNPLTDTSNQTFEIIKQWHILLGWGDIGYHWVIEKNGKIIQGRKESEEGAHCIGYNTKSIGICVVGNFDLTFPTRQQEESLKRLLIEIRERYNIPVENIVPHREFSNKTCYGKNLSDDWSRNLVIMDDLNKQGFTETFQKIIYLIKKYLTK